MINPCGDLTLTSRPLLSAPKWPVDEITCQTVNDARGRLQRQLNEMAEPLP